MSDDKATRERFEAWYPVNAGNTLPNWNIRSRALPDEYAKVFPQLAWEAWQAAQATPPAEPK